MGSALRVADCMTRVAFSIGDDQTLAEAALRMEELDVRHLPVLRGTRLVGIVSQRDLALLKATSQAHMSELSVCDAMTAEPYTVAPSAPLSVVAGVMGRERYGAAIVVEGGDVVGIFTSTDGMRALAQLAE